MNRCSLICAFIIGQLLSATAAAEPPNEKADSDTVTIPLDQIWALDMPGTRDIRKLEADVFSEDATTLSEDDRQRRFNQSLVNQIGGALRYLPPTTGKVAGLGFVVAGADLEALREAYAVLVKKDERRNSWPTDSNIWIVFFSHQCSRYVHVTQVERHGTVVRVRFRFVPHRTKEITSHFAIIPLGELVAGEYCVKIEQSPAKQDDSILQLPELSADEVSRIVCEPFSFVITGRE